MNRYGISRQEYKKGVTYRVRSLNETLNNGERITRWIDTDWTKQALADGMKQEIQKLIQRW